MRHLVRDVSRVLTLFLASRQAWLKFLGGEFRCLGGMRGNHKQPQETHVSQRYRATLATICEIIVIQSVTLVFKCCSCNRKLHFIKTCYKRNLPKTKIY